MNNFRSKNDVIKELQRMFRDNYIAEHLKLSLLEVDGKKELRWTYFVDEENHHVVFQNRGKRSRYFVLRSLKWEETFINEIELPDDFDVIFCTECDGIIKVKKYKNGDIRIKKLNKIKSWYLKNF